MFQGAANRKVAATNMNRASSRSHSVFTCIIESKVSLFFFFFVISVKICNKSCIVFLLVLSFEIVPDVLLSERMPRSNSPSVCSA